MVERTTTSTAHMVHTESTESYQENSMIDPDSLKNVDGPAKTRKGSSRFSKQQNSKRKSPRNSLTGETPDDQEDKEDSHNNTDLTARLAQTDIQMRKLSGMLTSSRDESIMTKDELPEEEVVVSGR